MLRSVRSMIVNPKSIRHDKTPIDPRHVQTQDTFDVVEVSDFADVVVVVHDSDEQNRWNRDRPWMRNDKSNSEILPPNENS